MINRLLAGAFAALLLAACTGINELRPGASTLDDALRLAGTPALHWQDADGTTHLAYPKGPAGFQTLLARFGPDGRLQSIGNVLDTLHFALIKPGMNQEQVLHVLGPPQPHWTMYFKARDELAWEWRYCDDWNAAARFNVLFDATAGTVRSTLSVRESCSIGDCLCVQ